jgi:hypothetical protein
MNRFVVGSRMVAVAIPLIGLVLGKHISAASRVPTVAITQIASLALWLIAFGVPEINMGY